MNINSIVDQPHVWENDLYENFVYLVGFLTPRQQLSCIAGGS